MITVIVAIIEIDMIAKIKEDQVAEVTENMMKKGQERDTVVVHRVLVVVTVVEIEEEKEAQVTIKKITTQVEGMIEIIGIITKTEEVVEIIEKDLILQEEISIKVDHLIRNRV
jgi:hypothetical protein